MVEQSASTAQKEKIRVDLFGSRDLSIERDVWIDYAVATETLMHLQWLIDHPESHRPPCCLIVGDTNNGKTSIARYFAGKHIKRVAPEPQEPEHPVVYIQAPPGPNLSILYSNLLRAVNAPTQRSWAWSRSQQQIVDLFPRLKVRMIIVDEVHNLLQGTRDQQSLFLNGLKYLTNELQIPVVVIGTKSAESVFQTDQQLGNRFKPHRLPLWEAGKDYTTFIIRLIKSKGYEPTDGWFETRIINKVHVMTGGLTGETTALISRVVRAAVEAGKLEIDTTFLEKVDWVKPGSRRSNARGST